MSEPDSDPPSHTGDWPAYKKKVLGDIESIQAEQRDARAEVRGVEREILKQLALIQASIATLNAKSGVYGAIAGAVICIAALLAKSLLK